MKRIFIYIAAAAALAACSKAEVIPVSNDAETEITYLTAPYTKASEFTATNIFQSIVYYLPLKSDGTVQRWDYAVYTTPTVYIGTEDANANATGVTIAKIGTEWRNAKYDNGSWVKDKSYYWPKKGTLTFFAWSLNSNTLAFPDNSTANVVCTKTEGVKLSGFDIDVDKNVDFMVAVPAMDKTENTPQYKLGGVTDGVPTLFKHKFSNLYFTVKTYEDYSSDVTFTLNSIVFKNLADKAGYEQKSDAVTATAIATSKSNQTYVTSSTQTVTDKETAVDTKGGQTIYLPQTFAADSNPIDTDTQTVEITYTVKYKTSAGTEITEEITETKKLCELFKDTTGTTGDGKWEMGHKYTLNLTFKLNEILWDPAVEDWTDVNKDVNII